MRQRPNQTIKIVIKEGNRNCCCQHFGSSQMKEQKTQAKQYPFTSLYLTVIAQRRGSVLPPPHYHLLPPNMDFPELYWASGQQSCQHTQCKTLPNQFCTEPTGSVLTRERGATAKPSLCAVEKSRFHAITVKMDLILCDLCGMLMIVVDYNTHITDHKQSDIAAQCVHNIATNLYNISKSRQLFDTIGNIIYNTNYILFYFCSILFYFIFQHVCIWQIFIILHHIILYYIYALSICVYIH